MLSSAPSVLGANSILTQSALALGVALTRTPFSFLGSPILSRSTGSLPHKIWQTPEEVDNAASKLADKVTVTINGREWKVPGHMTVLESLRAQGFDVPAICNHPRLGRQPGTCRLCQVEIDGKVQISCTKPIAEGMKIDTDTSDSVQSLRTFLLEAYDGCHPNSCINCEASGNCELQSYLHRYKVGKNTSYSMPHERDVNYQDRSSRALEIDFDKCIQCGRCVYACNQVQQMNVLGHVGRGAHRRPGTLGDTPLEDTHCIECGQCSVVCPVGAITERPDWQKVFEEIQSKRKVVVCQTAPAVRAALGETMGLEPGSATQGQMVAALKRIGFEHVFDTNYAADLTIMEEGTELIQRITKWIQEGAGPHHLPREGEGGSHAEGGEGQGHGHVGPLPMFTSCCPAWVTECEKEHPELLPHLSTAKSPQGMMGAVVKHYWADKMGMRPEDVMLVSIMPCTAKKHEADRPELGGRSGGTGLAFRHVDYVLTTREVGHMMKLKDIHLKDLKEEPFDDPLGSSTGAGVIFGVTGGVMEAALRTAYEVVTGERLPKVDLHAVRGLGGIREAVIPMVPKGSPQGTKPLEVRVAIASGIGYAKELLRRMQRGEVMYDFIEVMACPGGCIGGGGQPKTKDPAALVKRMRALYRLDASNTLRRSHENPDVQRLYREFLGEPNTGLAHDLLHTTYKDLSKKVVP